MNVAISIKDHILKDLLVSQELIDFLHFEDSYLHKTPSTKVFYDSQELIDFINFLDFECSYIHKRPSTKGFYDS